MKPWPDKLRAWMAVHPGFDTEGDLASAVGVHPRTVFRWLAGTSVPNQAAVFNLVSLSAPIPGTVVERKTPAAERIAGELKEINERLGQVLELLTRNGERT